MKIKFIDLFCGVGGFRLAIEQACQDLSLSYDCVFSSEINEQSRKTYKSNFKCVNFNKDITKIKAREVPHHDFLLGGFPCQSFSVLGKRKGFETNQGNLFFNIRDILREKTPNFFLLENVTGLLCHEAGKTMEIITQELKELNYKLFIGVLNARNFGLAQQRRRVLFAGFKDQNIKFKFPLKKETSRPLWVGDFLENKVCDSYTLTDEQIKTNNKNCFSFSMCVYNTNTRYIPTLTTKLNHSGITLIYQENKNPRRLTPREYFNFQGFPQRFKINNRNYQAYKQAGNSVPVPMIKEVIKEMLKTHH